MTGSIMKPNESLHHSTREDASCEDRYDYVVMIGKNVREARGGTDRMRIVRHFLDHRRCSLALFVPRSNSAPDLQHTLQPRDNTLVLPLGGGCLGNGAKPVQSSNRHLDTLS